MVNIEILRRKEARKSKPKQYIEIIKMKKFFKFNILTSANQVEVNTAIGPKPAQQETRKYPKEVYEIHNEFLTASEALLKEARDILNKEISQEKKGELALSLGFINIKESKEVSIEKQKKEEHAKILQAINDAYAYIPTHKWIPEDKALEICEKWNLVLGNVSNYIGFVPEKNLLEVQDFKEKYFDKFHLRIDHYFTSNIIKYTQVSKPYEEGENMGDNLYSNAANGLNYLRICAPIKDMKLSSGQYVEGAKIKTHIPDPIVLARRDFNYIKGYYIVTAWGDEASDPDVINHQNN